MSSPEPLDRPVRKARKPRSDGQRSRTAILEQAARLATIEGIGGLSIGRLAEAVGMSKSGLFAHFGSKEELQLATVEAAAGVFEAHVVEPAMRAPGGLARLHAFVDHYLRYVEQDVFPGGCFFAAALTEMNMQPGPVRDRLVAVFDSWLGTLADTVREGQAKGELDPNEDPDQLAFELEAAFFLANNQFVVKHSPEPLERARRTIEQRLAAITL
jgi:AcrR family transcriptional regulator